MKRIIMLTTLMTLLSGAYAYQYPQNNNEGSWNWSNRDPLAQEVVRQEKIGGMFDNQGPGSVNASTNLFGGMLIGGGNVENVNFAESQVHSSGSGNIVGQTSSSQGSNSQQASGTQSGSASSVTNSSNSSTLN